MDRARLPLALATRVACLIICAPVAHQIDFLQHPALCLRMPGSETETLAKIVPRAVSRTAAGLRC